MNRRQFSFAALSSATLLAGCQRESSEARPSRDATLLHNRDVRAAVTELQQGMDQLEMRLSQFNAENWQDALSAATVATTRLQADIDELRRSLGYADAS